MHWLPPRSKPYLPAEAECCVYCVQLALVLCKVQDTHISLVVGPDGAGFNHTFAFFISFM